MEPNRLRDESSINVVGAARQPAKPADEDQLADEQDAPPSPPFSVDDARSSSTSEPEPRAPNLLYASIARRFAAWVVDAIIVYAVVLAAVLVFNLVPRTGSLPVDVNLVSAFAIGLVSGVYFVRSWLGTHCATLGERWFKLQVRNAYDGRSLSVPRAILRWAMVGYPLLLAPFVGTLLSGAVTAALYVWGIALLVTTNASPGRQGLHDRVARSAVVEPVGVGSSKTAMASLALAIIALVGLAWVAYVDLALSSRPGGPGDYSGHAAPSFISTPISGLAGTSVRNLAPGTCHDTADASGRERYVAIVRPRTDPHTYQLMTILVVLSAQGAPYPGDEAVSRFADPLCSAAFVDYVGLPDTNSIYNYEYLTMTEAAWNAGSGGCRARRTWTIATRSSEAQSRALIARAGATTAPPLP